MASLLFDNEGACGGIRIFFPGFVWAYGLYRSQIKSKGKAKVKVKGVGQECPTHTSIAIHSSIADPLGLVCDR